MVSLGLFIIWAHFVIEYYDSITPSKKSQFLKNYNMDNEFILVERVCKDCGRTYEILVRPEDSKVEPPQCFNCYSVDYMSDEPEE